jgi:hypothetical protein
MANNLTKDYNFFANYFGQGGFDVVSATQDVDAHTYVAITALEASTTVTTDSVEGDNLNSTPIPAGCTVYGRFNSVECGSGKILVYREYVD